MKEQERPLSVAEVSRRLSERKGRVVTQTAVKGWLQSGKMQGFQDEDHQWRILEKDLDSFIAKEGITKKPVKSGTKRKIRR
jgi:hypothetical protein